MRKTLIATLLISFLLISRSAFSQFSLPKILSGISSKGITEKEAGLGIKEALTQGVTNAVLNLNRTDGFFGSDLYKMLLPPDARKAEPTIRRIGLGGQVDKAILAINRGAEDAVGSAAPIFTDAIKAMTVTDALGLIRGNKDAATQYFRKKTSADLIAAFSPSVKESLDRTQATKYYGDIANSYNRIPFGTGKVDFVALFAKLKSFGFKGPVMVEGTEVAATLEQTIANARANREFLKERGL